jgi:hypothetical protein
LYGGDHDVGLLIQEENRKRTYTIPSTGAMLTYRHAIGVLARFASSLVRANLLMLTWIIKANVDIISAIRERDLSQGRIHCHVRKRIIQL